MNLFILNGFYRELTRNLLNKRLQKTLFFCLKKRMEFRKQATKSKKSGLVQLNLPASFENNKRDATQMRQTLNRFPTLWKFLWNV